MIPNSSYNPFTSLSAPVTFDRAYNRLMELRLKLELALTEKEKEIIEKEIKEVEYELAYLEHIWLYE